jgi:hypothetical protein
METRESTIKSVAMYESSGWYTIYLGHRILVKWSSPGA